MITDTTKDWQKAIRDATLGVLNDPDNLFEFIDGGKFLVPSPKDPVDSAAFVEKALLASTLSLVWWSGDPNKHAPPVSESYSQDRSHTDLAEVSLSEPCSTIPSQSPANHPSFA